VRIIYEDARRFLARTPESYDVILMALPEPRNAQVNRYYTREFFRIVARRLNPQGVFSFSLTGAETSLHPLRAAYLGLAYHTLGQVFPEVLAYPGERVRFFATPTPGTLRPDPENLVARLKERGLNLQYVREYYLLNDMSPGRRDYLKNILNRQAPEVNTDLDPRCYFYDLVLSGTQEGLPLGDLLLFLQGLPGWAPWGTLGLATLLLGVCLRRRAGPLYLYQVLVMGLGTMALEIVVLILYQIHLGYLYRQLGLLIAAFMGGMAAGGAVGTRVGRRPRAAARLLATLQGGLAALAVLLALLLPRTASLPLPSWEILTQGGLALVLAAAGFGGGGIFALAAALWAQRRSDFGGHGGLLYAGDLLGATLGTLGVSLLVLPVWGLLPTLYLTAALHAGAGLMVAVREAS
jgi:spermidine synthase